MLFLDSWQLWKTMYHEGGVLVTTVDASGAGLRTLLQPDGDMLLGVSRALVDQQALIQRHLAEVALALSAVRRLRRTLDRYAVRHASVGWHIAGSALAYARQALGSQADTRVAERAWLSEGGLLCLILGTAWLLQRLPSRWLRAASGRFVALLTSAGPLLACGLMSAYERWGCSVGPCPGSQTRHAVLLPLLSAGSLGLGRLLFKYAARRYFQRALSRA